MMNLWVSQIARATFPRLLLVGLIASPAAATSAIYVAAGASGQTIQSFSLGVQYSSLAGLFVADSGPANGTTSSYTPSAAATGLTAITLTAAVNGNASGAAMGSADLAAGTVKATAISDTYFASANARAELHEDLVFNVAGGGSSQITVLAHLDGSISSFANPFSLFGLNYSLKFGDSSLVFTSQGSQSGTTYTVGGIFSDVPAGWDSYGITNQTATGFDFTGQFTVADGESRSFFQKLYLICQEGVNCDYSHTGSVALQLPDGVSFTSGSGVFLNPPMPPIGGAIPEPASWALMVAGFGLVGCTLRRRSRSVARIA